jgi:hypothetical protein
MHFVHYLSRIDPNAKDPVACNTAFAGTERYGLPNFEGVSQTLLRLHTLINIRDSDDPRNQTFNSRWKSSLNLSTMAVNVAFLVHR